MLYFSEQFSTQSCNKWDIYRSMVGMNDSGQRDRFLVDMKSGGVQVSMGWQTYRLDEPEEHKPQLAH